MGAPSPSQLFRGHLSTLDASLTPPCYAQSEDGFEIITSRLSGANSSDECLCLQLGKLSGFSVFSICHTWRSGTSGTPKVSGRSSASTAEVWEHTGQAGSHVF